MTETPQGSDREVLEATSDCICAAISDLEEASSHIVRRDHIRAQQNLRTALSKLRATVALLHRHQGKTLT